MSSILQRIINKFTYFPHNKIMRSTKDLPEFVSEKWIHTADGEKLQALYFEHKNKKTDLIIYFHGNTGNLFSHSRFDHAKRFYEMGKNVLLVSYRGYSKSSGKPNEKGIYLDGESAIKFANETLGYNNENIYIFGRSLGTTVAVEVAQHKNFKGVVLFTPLTSAKDMAKEMDFKLFSFLAKKTFNSIKKIKNLKSKLLIIHGTHDKQIPFKMGEKLFNKYKGEKTFIKIENAGHNNIQLVDPDSFWNGIEQFLKD